MMEFISHLRSREEGQALVEYALILSLIAVGTFVTAIQRTWWISARLRGKGRPSR